MSSDESEQQASPADRIDNYPMLRDGITGDWYGIEYSKAQALLTYSSGLGLLSVIKARCGPRRSQ